MIEKSPKFVYHMKGIFYTYRLKMYRSYNEYINADCTVLEEWQFGIQLRPKLYDRDYIEYDGCHAKWITILGVCFILNYTWDSEND